PRASRTVPFVAKATGRNLVEAACRAALGLPVDLAEDAPEHISVKAAVLPFQRFFGADPALGPEMRSTGEVMGIGPDFPTAFAKAERAAGRPLPRQGRVFLSVRDSDKPAATMLAALLQSLGFGLVATTGTARALQRIGIPVETVQKVTEGSPNVVDLIQDGAINLIINSPLGRGARTDGYEIREAAIRHQIPCITTLAGASAAVQAIAQARSGAPLVLRNDGGEVGAPGQFFMLQAVPEPSGAYLPRALSAAWADAGEIAFLLDVRGAGTAALAGAAQVSVLGPLGHGFELYDGPAILVGGGIGAAILPWLVRDLPGPVTTVLGFREQQHAVCAALIDADATVVLEPTYVTEPLARLLPADATVYACGPDPMLHAVAALCAEHAVHCLLAMEAAMACASGASRQGTACSAQSAATACSIG